MENTKKENIQIPIWQKAALTIDEASLYSNIGVNKLRKLAKQPGCSFVLHVGNKKLIKRKEFEKFIQEKYEI